MKIHLEYAFFFIFFLPWSKLWYSTTNILSIQMEYNHQNFRQTLLQTNVSATNKFVPQRMSLVQVNLLCNRVGLLFNRIVSCRPLFLYFNLFHHHTQFQKLIVTYLSNLSKLGQSHRNWLKRTLACYILHQIGNDSLTSTKLFIPSFTAVIYLRTDVALCSSSTKTVIVLKLICLCEEIMEECHNKKFIKNTVLCYWQWFPTVGQWICSLSRLVQGPILVGAGPTALQM